MNRDWLIHNVDPMVRLRLKVLALGHGMKIADMLEKLVREAWKRDEPTVTRKTERRIKRIVKRFRW